MDQAKSLRNKWLVVVLIVVLLGLIAGGGWLYWRLIAKVKFVVIDSASKNKIISIDQAQLDEYLRQWGVYGREGIRLKFSQNELPSEQVRLTEIILTLTDEIQPNGKIYTKSNGEYVPVSGYSARIEEGKLGVSFYLNKEYLTNMDEAKANQAASELIFRGLHELIRSASMTESQAVRSDNEAIIKAMQANPIFIVNSDL